MVYDFFLQNKNKLFEGDFILAISFFWQQQPFSFYLICIFFKVTSILLFFYLHLTSHISLAHATLRLAAKTKSFSLVLQEIFGHLPNLWIFKIELKKDVKERLQLGRIFWLQFQLKGFFTVGSVF